MKQQEDIRTVDMLGAGVIDSVGYAGSRSYLGSKAVSGAFQAIIAAMPAHDTYIETHLGSGAVMRAKPAALRSIGVDLDSRCLDRFDAGCHVELEHCSAHDFLQAFPIELAGRVLIYADPPYLHSVRTSRHRYRFEYTDADHVVLSDRLHAAVARGAMVMVSGYPSAMYDDLYAGWRTLEFQVMTRGGVRTEKLWMSFAADSAHWASYAGQNFTDRQRIKRKAQRWAENYRDLPAGERLAVLAALLYVEGVDHR